MNNKNTDQDSKTGEAVLLLVKQAGPGLLNLKKNGRLAKLMNTLNYDEDHLNAKKALATPGGRAAVVRALTAESGEVRYLAALTCSVPEVLGGYSDMIEPLIGLLESGRGSSGPHGIRQIIPQVLGQFQEQRVVDALASVLQDDQEEYSVRHFATESLMKIRTPEAKAALRKAKQS